LARREDDPEDPMALKFVSVVRLQFRSGEVRVCGKTFFLKKAVLGIRIRNRIRMFSSLPDPDPLVRLIPVSDKCVERTEIVLTK
jgi:hypothetical protein